MSAGARGNLRDGVRGLTHMSLFGFQDETRRPNPYVLLVRRRNDSNRLLEQLLVEDGFAVEVVRDAGEIADALSDRAQVVIDMPEVEAEAVIRRLREERKLGGVRERE